MIFRIASSVTAFALLPAIASAQQLKPSLFGGLTMADQKREVTSADPGGRQITWHELRGGGAHRVGWTAGAAVRWSPVERTFLVGEIGLTSKGFESESEGMDALHLEFPLLVELVLFGFGGKGVALHGGVAWSREVACSASAAPGPTPAEVMVTRGDTGRQEVGCGRYRESRYDRSAVFGARVGPFAILGADVTPEARIVTGRLESQVISYFYRARNRGLAFRLSVSPR
jgi:hypothetical protein